MPWVSWNNWAPEMKNSSPYLLGADPNCCPAQNLGQTGPDPIVFWDKLAERQCLTIKMPSSEFVFTFEFWSGITAQLSWIRARYDFSPVLN